MAGSSSPSKYRLLGKGRQQKAGTPEISGLEPKELRIPVKPARLHMWDQEGSRKGVCFRSGSSSPCMSFVMLRRGRNLAKAKVQAQKAASAQKVKIRREQA